ncbi:MAG: energy transducer TonB, partial [Porphyromonadaceae bacterium]|nr:energy transducer TonB [Porphyromonadaceae bacterium]
DEPFEVVEEQPEFIGGQDAFRKFLQNNLRYPERAADEGIQGRVMVRFIVERDGSVSAVEVAKGVDPDLDKEAVRVVKALPKWKPGRQQGKAVRTRYMLPIVFTLQ